MPSEPLPRSIGQEGPTTALGLSQTAPYWGNAVNAYADYAGNLGNLWNAILFGGGGPSPAPTGDPRLPWNLRAQGTDSALASAILGAQGQGSAAWQQGLREGNDPFQAMGRGGMPAGGAAPAGGMGGILGSLLGAQSATSRGSLASDLSALSSAGRSGFDAITGTVPGQSAMLEELNRQIYGDLQAGAELDPRDRYRLMQESRAAGASRGMGFGPSDSAAETMALWLGGEDLKRRRQEAAQKQAGLNFGLVTDPMLGMLDRGTDVFGLATQLGMSQIPNLDPFNAYASDLYNTNYNAAWANVLNSRNNAAARSAANKAMIGQIVGGVLGGAAGAACYLAREVFGEESPRWREFRTWLLGYAPPALRAWYLDNAAAVARLVRDLPRVKDDLRRWMTAKIEEVPHAV